MEKVEVVEVAPAAEGIGSGEGEVGGWELSEV